MKYLKVTIVVILTILLFVYVNLNTNGEFDLFSKIKNKLYSVNFSENIENKTKMVDSSNNEPKSLNNEPLIQIIPIPNESFTKNKLTIKDAINDNEYNYDHIGDYIASSSSYSNDKNTAENAFNPTGDAFWQCDYANNPEYNKNTFDHKPYKQNPYVKSDVGKSIYQPNGGGAPNTKFTTIVNIAGQPQPIKGEWLQIQIPNTNPIYLYKYSILTPPPVDGVITFPKNFTVVGSNDGIKWNYIDQQVMIEPVDTTNRKPVVFNLNCREKYNIFRLIINSLFVNNDIVLINKWELYGTPKEIINRDAFTQRNERTVPAKSNIIENEFISSSPAANYTFYSNSTTI